MARRGRERRPGAVADAAIGAASGLAASWVMSAAYGPLWRAGSEETRRREQEAQGGMPPATIRAAEAAAAAVGRELPERRKGLGGWIVHYAYGVAWGAAFALGARAAGGRRPVATGLAFGVALWLLSDEVLVPLFRFSRPPTRYPATTHAKGLAAHLVYGVATDVGWRLGRAAWR
ncbi:MAG TPA: DUF6789 family protein [Anaeromyxobacter sp.]|nr:DUF6789 family protein [Anaeromyxobacter sp.]